MTGERYQGIIVAKNGNNVGCEFYGPSQEGVMKSYISDGRLPDGRRVLDGKWLREPVDKRGIEAVKFVLLKGLFGSPKRN